jgi:hypothetical protein
MNRIFPWLKDRFICWLPMLTYCGAFFFALRAARDAGPWIQRGVWLCAVVGWVLVGHWYTWLSTRAHNKEKGHNVP